MHRIGIVDSAAPCRLCEEDTTESVEHFLLHCSAIQEAIAEPLSALMSVAEEDPPDFNTLCWTHPKEVKQLLTAAERAGAWI